MAPDNHTQFRNRLLSAFAQDDLDEFFSYLHPESVPLRQTIYSEGGPMEDVYFVEEGLASVLKGMENGFTIEVGMIGIEGMVGMPALLGAETSAHQVIIQIPAKLLRMDAARCKLAFDQSAAVRTIVHRFAVSFLNQSAQTAACNRLHSVEQRCARWLLMSSDRVQSDMMPMTHEFLSVMLGVRRAGVSEVAEQLQRSGIIQYHRGQLRIIDREALEATACECYQLDRARFDLLLRPSKIEPKNKVSGSSGGGQTQRDNAVTLSASSHAEQSLEKPYRVSGRNPHPREQ